jgi:hypothetical protein
MAIMTATLSAITWNKKGPSEGPFLFQAEQGVWTNLLGSTKLGSNFGRTERSTVRPEGARAAGPSQSHPLRHFLSIKTIA